MVQLYEFLIGIECTDEELIELDDGNVMYVNVNEDDFNYCLNGKNML